MVEDFFSPFPTRILLYATEPVKQKACAVFDFGSPSASIGPSLG